MKNWTRWNKMKLYHEIIIRRNYPMYPLSASDNLRTMLSRKQFVRGNCRTKMTSALCIVPNAEEHAAHEISSNRFTVLWKYSVGQKRAVNRSFGAISDSTSFGRRREMTAQEKPHWSAETARKNTLGQPLLCPTAAATTPGKARPTDRPPPPYQNPILPTTTTTTATSFPC